MERRGNPNIKYLGRKITKENAREMQAKSMITRAQNTEERKNAALVAKAALDRVIKSKNGTKASVREVIVETLLNNAINEKDIKAIAYLLDLAGEGVEKRAQVDITSGGQPIEPVTGMIVLPPNYQGSIDEISNGKELDYSQE